MRGWLAVPVVAVLLAGCGGGTTRSGGPVSAGSTIPGRVDGPIGPARFVGQAPVGWRHDAEGARAAAVSDVTLLSAVVAAGPLTRRDLLKAIATRGFAPRMADLTQELFGEATNQLMAAGGAPSDLSVVEAPAAAQVTSISEASATVQVWSVGVMAVKGGSTLSAWHTVTATLSWEGEDWRVADWGDRPGPTPVSPGEDGAASGSDLAAVMAWGPAAMRGPS